jgi:uncharacterized protein
MEALAEELLQKTGTAVVVATIKTVGDNDPDTYANELYANWGIGRKGEDNGVLIFLAVSERRIRIETGYGVEGILPDGLVGSILDQYVIPYLRQNDYAQGLLNGMRTVGQIIARDAGVTLGDSSPPASGNQQRPGQQGFDLLQLLFFLLIIIIIISLRISSRRGRMGGRDFSGTGFNGRCGGLGSRSSGGGFSGGFGGFGGGLSGGGGAGRSF